MDLMVKTVHLHVTINVMVVTTSMVFVIGDVNRAGRETTVNNVMYLHNQHKYLHNSNLHVMYLSNIVFQSEDVAFTHLMAF